MAQIDDRTKTYFAEIRESLGYRGYNAGWYDIQEILDKKTNGTVKAELIKTYPGYTSITLGEIKIEIYRYEIDGEVRYCAQLGYQTDIDDYCIETHIFTREPSREDIYTIRDIQHLEANIQYRGLKTEFTCWECGCRTHWLDIPGTLQQKLAGLQDQYCGC